MGGHHEAREAEVPAAAMRIFLIVTVESGGGDDAKIEGVDDEKSRET